MPSKRPRKVQIDDVDVANEVGFDDGTDQGVVLRLSTTGRAFLQPVEPAGVAKLDALAQEKLAQLQRSVLARQQLLLEVNALVPELRELGVSWQLIGWCVGTSGEAARQRWMPQPPASPPAKPVTAARRRRTPKA